MRSDWLDLLLVGVLLAAPALGIMLFADAAWGLLRYDRPAVLDGQLWRLLSAHWIHLGPTHLAVNLAGLALVLAVLGRLLTPTSLLLSALFGALGVGLGLLLFSPGLYWYAGLSGMIASIWGTASARGARCGSWLGWASLALLLGRVLLEQLAGPSPALAQLIGGAVIVDAHLYGAATGVLIGVLLPRLTTRH
ncbi:MAG: rhombosortase [Aquisalimonadaceae bacterium]